MCLFYFSPVLHPHTYTNSLSFLPTHPDTDHFQPSPALNLHLSSPTHSLSLVLRASLSNHGLVLNSLICDSSDRLGRNGAQEIKGHAFFRGVFGTELRSIRAPFEPKLSSNVDVSYFPIDEIEQDDTAATLLAQTNQQILETGANADMSLPFVGYTYKRFNSFRGQ